MFCAISFAICCICVCVCVCVYIGIYKYIKDKSIRLVGGYTYMCIPTYVGGEGTNRLCTAPLQ